MKDLDSTLGHRGHRRSGKPPLLLHQLEPLRQLVSAELLNVSAVEVRSASFKKVYHRPLVLKCFFYDRIKIWRKNHLKLGHHKRSEKSAINFIFKYLTIHASDFSHILWE